jgi:hypothetical protein
VLTANAILSFPLFPDTVYHVDACLLSFALKHYDIFLLHILINFIYSIK